MQWRTGANFNLKDWWYGICTLFIFKIELRLLNLSVDIKPILFELQFDTKLPAVINYRFITFFHKGFKISEHKRGEIQLWFESTLNTGIEMFKTIHTDHGRFEIGFSILGFSLHFSIYDTRHWNDNKNRYYRDDDVIEEGEEDEE